jgi:hypothetical protein
VEILCGNITTELMNFFFWFFLLLFQWSGMEFLVFNQSECKDSCMSICFLVFIFLFFFWLKGLKIEENFPPQLAHLSACLIWWI